MPKSVKSPRTLTDEQRLAVYHFLLEKKNGASHGYKSIHAAAAQWSVSKSTIRKIWRQGNKSIQMGAQNPDVSARKTGRKKKVLDRKRINDIPVDQRTPLSVAPAALNVSMTTLDNRIKDGELKVSSEGYVYVEGNKKERRASASAEQTPTSSGLGDSQVQQPATSVERASASGAVQSEPGDENLIMSREVTEGSLLFTSRRTSTEDGYLSRFLLECDSIRDQLVTPSGLGDGGCNL